MQPSAITSDTKKDEKKNAKSLIVSDVLRENRGSGDASGDFELIDGRGQDPGSQRLCEARR